MAPRLHDTWDYEGPLVEAIVILHVFIKGTTAVNLLQRNLLRDHFLDVGLWDLKLPLNRILPVYARHVWMILNLISSSLPCPQTLVRVSV